MYEILMVVYLVLALALIAFILIQKGKGAGMGASFGAGASGTVFGSSGSGNFLTKTTTFLAIGFFAVALALGYMTSTHPTTQSSDSLFTEEDLQTLPGSEIPEASAQDDTQIPQIQATETEIPQADADKEEQQGDTPK